MSKSVGKIRIVEMIDRPSLGGGQTALLLLAKNLDARQFDVFVSSAGGGPLVDEALRSGLPHLPVPLSKRIKLGTIKEISALLESRSIDILHTHGGVAGLYGRWAARRSRVPVIVHTLHGIHYLHYRNPMLRAFYILLERRFSRFTEAVICVSQSDYQKAKKHRLAAEGKLSIIANGIDLRADWKEEKIRALRQAWGWPPDRPVIGTVARLHRQKGILYLLQAAPKILAAFPGARIAVVGEGELGHKLRTRAGKMGLEEKFVFLGERTDALEILSLFDIFVLPSLWEGLPFVLVEAAALQKPIVATAVDGVTEVIEDGKTGLLVPPKNHHALAEAVIRLLRDKDEAARLAAAAKAAIPGRFSLRRMVDETQTLYLELYRRKRS